MSVESEILRIQHNIANSYAAVSSKGGEVPLNPTSANLAAAVSSIPQTLPPPDNNPIGTVISFMGTSAPEGYLVCDGAQYSISQYPALASFFEAQFGTKNHFGGDGTSTFAIPDMRNLFLRGYHGEAEEQLSGEIGAKQDGTYIPNVYPGKSSLAIYGEKGTREPYNKDKEKNKTYTYQSFALGSNQTSSHEQGDMFSIRPENMSVLYCIKAAETGGSGGSSAWEVYSTEETRIGTWIDGKPLYRKTFKTSHSSVPNKSWLNCGTIQDLEYGMVVNGTVTVPSENNILNLQSSLFRTRITKNNGIVAFYTENFSSGVVAVSCVTVEYTKTTD